MARTKTRPSTREERWPNGPPRPMPPVRPVIHNNVPFKDHTGKPALMSWRSRGPFLLPPLASWVFYMVHPDVPRDFDGCQFEDDFSGEDTSIGELSARFEFFFLPGATAEECLAHYRGEMEARGTIWRQVTKVKAAIKHKEGGNGEEPSEEFDGAVEEPSRLEYEEGKRLPGLVWLRLEDDWQDYRDSCYRGWFFIYLDAELKLKGADGESRLVDRVLFDPDIGELDEEELAHWNPMDHPIDVKRIKVRDKGAYDAGAVGWMDMKTIDNWAAAAVRATNDAMKLGWASW